MVGTILFLRFIWCNHYFKNGIVLVLHNGLLLVYFQAIIAELMKSENGGTFVINSRDQIEVKDYKGKRYACIKFERLGKDGETTYTNRMNFDEKTWEILMENKLNDEKKNKKKKKTMKRRQQGSGSGSG